MQLTQKQIAKLSRAMREATPLLTDYSGIARNAGTTPGEIRRIQRQLNSAIEMLNEAEASTGQRV